MTYRLGRRLRTLPYLTVSPRVDVGLGREPHAGKSHTRGRRHFGPGHRPAANCRRWPCCRRLPIAGEHVPPGPAGIGRQLRLPRRQARARRHRRPRGRGTERRPRNLPRRQLRRRREGLPQGRREHPQQPAHRRGGPVLRSRMPVPAGQAAQGVRHLPQDAHRLPERGLPRPGRPPDVRHRQLLARRHPHRNGRVPREAGRQAVRSSCRPCSTRRRRSRSSTRKAGRCRRWSRST